jgi:hypothetical protein
MRRPALLSTLLLALACGPQATDADDDAADAACVPGEQRACACPDGGPAGAQVCLDAGDRFGPCFGCDDGTTDLPTTTTTTAATPPETTTTTTTTTDPPTSTTDLESSSGGPLPGEPSGPPQAVPPAPPPDGSAVVDQVASEHPDWLINSCKDTGGTNEFMFEVVRRLRQQDDRWGLNWKRGVIGDLSQDVVDYHYGDGVSEESTDVYIIDIIVGHCGPEPGAGWIDVTQATLDANTIGMWTLAGQSF